MKLLESGGDLLGDSRRTAAVQGSIQWNVEVNSLATTGYRIGSPPQSCDQISNRPRHLGALGQSDAFARVEIEYQSCRRTTLGTVESPLGNV